ncbi:hypothetical protein ASPWEDRAFT_192296 [Aspergillus wentii DTO 134E9]|uniref:WAP domain-containing protein n=1 Tax=Aspergillus wentii DTO 134E9 TaxID=1073089 RepID=A0A1L9RYY7_ASPWE|nr:uncharacterized protein ASPWEDRAFT_192296 [Aspergillus wentii DTO 134E9]KAI9932548.1 hypothetical protein MW887_008790 [Aspergillus wentii]OJJ40113.1 hypothetical protein ASPWEDRAFT_192296 [Aspergillus wentii DTO 134E9]
MQIFYYLSKLLLWSTITSFAAANPVASANNNIESISKRDICKNLDPSGFFSKSICVKVTINNAGCSVSVKYSLPPPSDNFVFTASQSTFYAVTGTTISLDASPLPGHKPPVWTGTSSSSNPTTLKLPVLQRSVTAGVTCDPIPPPTCVPDGDPCTVGTTANCCGRACCLLGQPVGKCFDFQNGGTCP